MARRSSFAQLLDEKLQEISGNHQSTAQTLRARGIAGPHPFLFSTPYHFDRTAARRVTPPALDERRARLSLPPAPRTLTSEQRAALDALNRRGARLTADFTMAELRYAYRALAHRYHPDRHHSSSAAEQAQFGAAFAEIAKQYKRLAASASRE